MTSLVLSVTAYSDVNCEYEAPLGDEFRKLVNVFIDPEAISLDMKYMMADNIVRQLRFI